jgi:sugar phosphate isomerase/epimerase
MFNRTKLFVGITLLSSMVVLAGTPAAFGQSGSTKDRWLHVRVINSDNKGETVRVNIPLELAENVLPTINKNHLHNGKVTIDQAHMNDVDLRALINAIRTAKDGEYVTVQGTDQDVRVAKEGGRLLVHVKDNKGSKLNKSDVDIKIPMHVIDALFSAGKDELDVVAGLHALASLGDTELVSVKSEDSTVRVWMDSKNSSD